MHLVKIACERPDKVGRSLSHWDCAELARQLIADGVVDSISPQTVQRILAHHKLKHRIMTMSPGNWQKASTAYGVRGIPHVALIDRKGILRMVRVGSSPDNTEDLHTEIKKLVAEK